MKKLSMLLVLLLALLMVFAMAACNDDSGDDGEKGGPTEPKLNQGNADCSHIWGDWQEQTESTCTKKGTELKTCTLCGKEESRRVPATGHYFTEGVCAACGRQERACNHQTVEQVVIKEPTCTEPGQRNSICTICDAVIGTNQIYPTGHGQLTTVVEQEPTCTENGRAKEVCGICGEVDKTYTIYSEGHTDTEWVTVTEPTCTENGYEQQICHACDQIVDEYYSSYYGHSYDYIASKVPTCTEDGWYEYRVCSVCNETNYEDKFRPATGHDHIAGLCCTCGATDPNFVKTEIADIPKLEHTIAKPADAVFAAPEAQIITYNPTVTTANEEISYTFTAVNGGVYYFWVSELYSGNSVNLYIKNYLGETEGYKSNLENNEGFYVSLSAGQVYTLVAVTRTCATPGSYEVNVGCQTAKADVSAYTTITDSIAFNEQVNHYLFTPEVNGIYRFWFTDLYNNIEVNIYVYNDLNECIASTYGCGNNEAVILNNMAAGKTYRIAVEYRNGKSAYTLHMGKQQEKVDVSAYNTIHDNIFYKEQINYYTFTAPADGFYRFQMANITNNGEVNLRLYNSLGEQVGSVVYCSNGEGFSKTNLVAGETYTISVEYESGLFGYTLYIYSEKPVVELTGNTGAADSFEYGEQNNYYTFTATEGGTYRIAITGMNANVDICLYIYDANGQQVAADTYCYNGEYLTLSNLAPGATYTIRVYANGTLTDYIVSVQ